MMPVNDLGDEAAAAIFVGKDFVFGSKVVIWSQILSSPPPVLLSAEGVEGGCVQPQVPGGFGGEGEQEGDRQQGASEDFDCKAEASGGEGGLR